MHGLRERAFALPCSRHLCNFEPGHEPGCQAYLGVVHKQVDIRSKCLDVPARPEAGEFLAGAKECAACSSPANTSAIRVAVPLAEQGLTS